MAEERKGGRGGRREGSGRPRIQEGESRARPRMCMRAWPDEWELLKRFKKTIAKDKDASKAALEELEQKVFCGKESRQKKVQ